MNLQISNIKHINKVSKPLSFGGYKDVKKADGRDFIKFYAPPYDKNKYEISLEIAPAKKENSKWIVDSENIIQLSKSIEQFKNDGVYHLSKDYVKQTFLDDFAYRYKLTAKNGESFYIHDAGTKTESGDFNIISTEQGYTGGISGPMYHMFINSFAPSKEAKENMKTRNHFNDAGGNIQGVIDHLKNSDTLDSYSLILSTPIFGADNVSSHGYWSANPYQLSEKAGDLNDYKDLQKALFDKGKAWITDGVFASQGFNSPQMASVLKWGDKSPFNKWFRLEQEKIKFGILPSQMITNGFVTTENPALSHIKYKIVEKEGKDGLTTNFIQFYDDRLASKKQQTDNDFIKKYDNYQTDDIYEIKTNSDSVQPYSFPLINVGRDHMNKLREFEGKSLAEIENWEILEFDNFAVTTKRRAQNANFWDGNIDLVKLNLSNPDFNDASIIGCIQARNYAYNAANYWTKITTNSILEHLVTNFADKGVSATLKDVEKSFNVKLDSVKQNVENGVYENKFLENANPEEFLMQEILNFPLEAVSLPKDITAVLSSPYITARPVVKNDEAKQISELDKDGNYYSQFVDTFIDNDTNKQIHSFNKVHGQMLDFYKNDILVFVTDVLKKIDTANMSDSSFENKNNIFEKDGKTLTEYGIYLSKVIVPEILQYVIGNSVFGELHPVDIKDGKIVTDKNVVDSNSYSSLIGQSVYDPEDEAIVLVNKMKNNFAEIKGETGKLATYFADKFKTTNINDFKLAQAVIDQTGAGLNWRFDAAKDIGDLDAVRIGKAGFEKVWQETIDFWHNFVENIREENPASYIIGEVTDLWSLYNSNIDFGKFQDPDTAERVFLEETGITTDTNYSHTFSSVPALFDKFLKTLQPIYMQI